MGLLPKQQVKRFTKTNKIENNDFTDDWLVKANDLLLCSLRYNSL